MTLGKEFNFLVPSSLKWDNKSTYLEVTGISEFMSST